MEKLRFQLLSAGFAAYEEVKCSTCVLRQYNMYLTSTRVPAIIFFVARVMYIEKEAEYGKEKQGSGNE